jgi:hypothetical protein
MSKGKSRKAVRSSKVAGVVIEKFAYTGVASYACGSEVRLQLQCLQPAHTLRGERKSQNLRQIRTERLSVLAKVDAAAANLLVEVDKRS